MNPEALIDAELVRKFNGGDASAFCEIMNRHKARIFSAAMALLRNHADAEEITQDTFVRAHRGLATFRGESSLSLPLTTHWFAPKKSGNTNALR